jgi:DNA-binding transcriptional regulator LsrR (DeoR family)
MLTKQQIFYEQRAKFVRWYFLNTNMTRADLAKKLGMSYSTVCSLVKGVYRTDDNRGPLSNWRKTCGRN